MQARDIHLNGTYRMKLEVFAGTVQADGTPHTSPDVTIVRVKSRPGYKTCWYFDAKGNAFASSDLMPIERIEVEL